jgi:electron transfer flavoprotein beta subunit
MNIVVCVKQVPDTNEVKIDLSTNNLVREGIPCMMNPFDRSALEAALGIRDKLQGKVTAVSMGPLQAAAILQDALDMGIDRAILLSDRLIAGSDTLATGYVLSVLVKSLNPDLVICGSEAVDGATGQVGPSIAENLGFPQLTYVNEIIKVDGKHIEVSRELRDVYEILSCTFPALICVLKNIDEPRPAIRSKRKPEIFSAGDFELDNNRIGIGGSPTRVIKIDMSNRRPTSFVVIDSSLSADERIAAVIGGGFVQKKVNLTRGTAAHLAKFIFQDDVFSGYLCD